MILLDTHVWVWWVSDPDRLSPEALREIEEARKGQGVLISSISAWEVGLLVARGRLKLTIPADDWVRRCERIRGIRFVPVNNRIALRSVLLPGPFHPDPADRIIVATALETSSRLVTKDRRILEYPHVPTLW